MRCAIGIALVGLAALSHGSFDLMLTPDAAGGIQRFDPTNGASFGKFGGQINYDFLDASLSSKYVAAHATSLFRAFRFDYSTGARVGNELSVSTPVWSNLSTDSDTISYSFNGASNTVINKYSLSTGNFLSVLNVSTTTINCDYTELNSSFGAITYLNASNVLVAQGISSSAGTAAGAAITTTIAGTAYSGLVPVLSGPTKYYVGTVKLPAGTGPATWSLVRYFVNPATGVISGFGSQALSGFSVGGSDFLSVAPAHQGFYLVGRDSTNPTSQTRISEFDDNGLFTQMNTYTMNFQTPTGAFKPGIVLAPEPGTWAALGLGAFALLRRRQHQAGA